MWPVHRLTVVKKSKFWHKGPLNHGLPMFGNEKNGFLRNALCPPPPLLPPSFRAKSVQKISALRPRCGWGGKGVQGRVRQFRFNFLGTKRNAKHSHFPPSRAKTNKI